MFDLEGHKLTAAQKGGLAVALVVPGTGLLTAGGIGTALLLRKARQASDVEDPLERLFSKCLKEAILDLISNIRQDLISYWTKRKDNRLNGASVLVESLWLTFEKIGMRS